MPPLGIGEIPFRREAAPLRQETRMSQCVASWIAAADRFPLWLGGMTHRRVARIAVRSNRIGSQSSPCNTSATVLGNVARAPTQTRGGRRRVAGTRRWYYIEDFDVCAEFLVTWRHPLQGIGGVYRPGGCGFDGVGDFGPEHLAFLPTQLCSTTPKSTSPTTAPTSLEICASPQCATRPPQRP